VPRSADPGRFLGSAYLRMLRRDSGYCGRIRQVHFPVATELRKGPCCADRRTCPSRHSLLKTKLSSLGVRSHFVSVCCQPRADCGVFGCPEGPTAGALGGTRNSARRSSPIFAANSPCLLSAMRPKTSQEQLLTFQLLVAFAVIATALLDPLQTAIGIGRLVSIVLIEARVHPCFASGFVRVLWRHGRREDCVTRAC
jgi:hypothetical protein